MDMVQRITGDENSKSLTSRLDVFGVHLLHIIVYRGNYLLLPFLMHFIELEAFDSAFDSESISAMGLAAIIGSDFMMVETLKFVKGHLELMHFYRLDPVESEMFSGYRNVFKKFQTYKKGSAFMRALKDHNISDPFPNCPPHFTPLYVAVLADNVEAVRLLLARGANVHHYISNGDFNLLHVAARHNRYKIIPLLIQAGANVTERNPSERTPFCVAARWGHLAAMKAFYSHEGFNLSASNGNLALFCASQEGQFHVIPTLIHLGCDVQMEHGLSTPLDIGVIYNHAGVVRTLLKLNADPSPVGLMNNTLLHVAAVHGSSDVMKPLLDIGCSLYNINDLMLTPPEQAIFSNQLAFLKAAIDLHGYDVNAQDQFGYTLLHTMILLRHTCNVPNVKVLRKLVFMGCSLYAPMDDGYLPIHFATQYNDTEAIRAFVNLGCDVNVATMSEKKRRPIHIAAGLNCVEAIDALVELGCNLEIQQVTKLKLRPLHLTVVHRSKEACQKLIEKGADVHSRTGIGMTAIFFAIMQNAYDMLEVLVRNGASISDTYDVTVQKASQFYAEVRESFTNNPLQSALTITPLNFAISLKFRECVVKLLELGASAKDMHNTLCSLHLAAQLGLVDIVCDLIDHGADVDESRPGDGFTPLHFAIMEKHTSVVRVLLEKGCDVTKCTIRHDNPDLSPLQLASLMCHSDIVEVISQHGGDSVINCLTAEGLSPLHLALLNPKIRTTTESGEVVFSPVGEDAMDMYQKERENTVCILMHQPGIQLNLTDEEGITPLDIAIQKKLKDIVFILVEAWGLRGDTKLTIDRLKDRIEYLEGIREERTEPMFSYNNTLIITVQKVVAMQEQINQLQGDVDDLKTGRSSDSSK